MLVRALRIWGTDPDGIRHLLTDRLICETCDTENHVWGYHMPRNLWRDPAAWNQPNNGSVFTVRDNTVVKIPTSRQPLDLFHLWNARWPRPSVQPGWTYEAEAEVLPEGAGMIQVGLDFWSLPNGGTNIEAANSHWVCSKTGSNWVTVRAGGIR